MPNAALKPCKHQPCSALVVSGACPAHQAKDNRDRGSSAKRGYDIRWRKLRVTFLNQRCECSEPPLATCSECRGTGLSGRWCRECLDQGQLIPATEVDHVIPWLDFPELRLELKNLQGICASHHSDKTSAETHGTDLSEFQQKQQKRVMKELFT